MSSTPVPMRLEAADRLWSLSDPLHPGTFGKGEIWSCASDFTVWVAVGQRGIDQVYKLLCIYAEEPAPAPVPPPACGVLKGSL